MDRVVLIILIIIHRLLLPYERNEKGQDTKVRPTHGRRTKTSSSSEEAIEIKDEPDNGYQRETTPPNEPPNSTTVTPSLQSILSISVIQLLISFNGSLFIKDTVKTNFIPKLILIKT